MITGKRAFEGEDVSDTLAFILTKEPHWDGLPTTTPRSIRTLLRRCLEKDRKRRLDSAADARLEIEDALTAPTAEVALSAVSPRRSRERLAWMSALVAVALIAVVAVVWARRPVLAGRVSRFVITTPPGAPIRGGNQRGVAISPDGSRLVYRSSPQAIGIGTAGVLYIREVNQLAAMPLHGAEGAVDPAFSRDGRSIVYGDIRANALKRIPVDGGPPKTICSLDGGNPRGASWGPDDMIVFATDRSRGLLRVPAAGGTPTRLTTADPRKGEQEHSWPDVLPDGQGVLFTVSNGFPEQERVAVVALPSGQVTSLFDGTSPRFVPTGHVLFGLGDGTLRAVGFDARRLKVIGNPLTMVEHVGMSTYGAARFAVADEGSLVYSTEAGTVPPRTLVWVNRKGQEEPIPVQPHAYTYARLSPNEKYVALDARDEQNDIWIWDLTRQSLQRLTTDPGMNRSPVWTPDSRRVAFTAVRDGVESVYWQAFDGSGTMERLSSGTQTQGPTSFSPDAAQLIFSTPLIGPYDLGVLTVATHTARMLLHSTASETNGELSPDGHWLAYESDESGQPEIYVSPFSNVEVSKSKVSTAGGTRPLWSRDRRELFYYVSPDTIMAVPVRLGADVVIGTPQPVVKGPYAVALNGGRHYDVSADGQRFLLLKDAPTPDGQKAAPVEIHIVLNWLDELKARVPTK
jgi:Tol biopolymer transport system component